MRTSARSYVTAGVALMGAGVISATPVTSQLDLRMANYDVNLVAATQSCAAGSSSALCAEPTGLPAAAPFVSTTDSTNMFNIPANLFIALANTPYNFFTALGDGNVHLGGEPDGGPSFQPTYEGITLTQPDGNVVGLGADLYYGGSWWVYSPTNILGTDTADVPRYQALANVLVPFPALSVPLGNMFAAIAASQLPMNSGCTGTGPGACDDPTAILSKMFDLRHIGALFSPEGYTFPETREGISCSADGQCYVKDPDGQEVPWSGETVKLDPTKPFTSFYDSLTGTPDFSQIKPVTPELITASLTSLGRGLNTAFNPFVLGTQCSLCAPFVPNPDNKPIPGPVFEDPDTTTTTTTTTSTLAADTTDTATSDKATAQEATTALTAPAVTAAPAAEAPAAEAPATDDGAAASKGPKHRKPTATSEAVKQVRDSINASVSKLSDSFKKKPDTTSSDAGDASSAKKSGASESSAKKAGASDSGAKKSTDSGSGGSQD
ncbi:hypothetical protein [Mycolicibacterium chlorophenolicum]|uniref:PE-PPE domain-containing protein n=1 Tax=Mycolicibacterium chlorophenolicum TaxID=37916 RepID=A0A0J6W0T9_9MYCO|nr:hypothetical protein [Mycolicibacterium chlorophenolicum]KMO75353.1 hypothetical protein MCHLDSM_03573 [Mycolicibacterium chlorophenolicum]